MESYKNREWLTHQYLEKGKTIEQIAKLEDTTKTTISRWCKKFNIKKGTPLYYDKNWLYEQYFILKKTLYEIAKIHEVDPSTIQRHMRKNFKDLYIIEAKIRSNKARQKYIINIDYFKEINNNIKAYWLGVIYADGCIRKCNKNNYSFELSSKDLVFLKKFKKDVNTDYPIKKIKPKTSFHNGQKIISDGSYEINIYNSDFCLNLIKWGVITNKTKKLKKIPNIPKQYIPDFIRGYFDGDGNIFIKKYKYKNIHRINKFSLFGHEPFLLDIRKFIVNELKIYNGYIQMRYDWNWISITWGNKKDLLKIYYFLYYKDDLRFMRRKKEIFKKILTF